MNRWLIARDAQGHCIDTVAIPQTPLRGAGGVFAELEANHELRRFLHKHFPDGQWMEVTGSTFRIRGPQSERLGTIEASADIPADLHS